MAALIRCAVIGAGDFAGECHIPGLQSHAQAEVVALCGRREAHARGMADRFGIPDVHTDYREVIARDDLDAITIVTPNVSHAEIAVAAFQVGKHVFCEKPLAMNGSQARVMLDAARDSGCIHMVSFTLRYLYSVRLLRALVRQGAIGRVHYVRLRGEGMGGLSPSQKARWRDVMAISGGGLVQDMGSHYMDLVNWTVGPVSEACGLLLNVPRSRPDALTGESTPIDSDDLSASFFRTATGIQGDYLLSRVTPSHGEWGLEVVGDEGALMAFLTRGDRDELRQLDLDGNWESVPLAPEASIRKPLALGRMMRSFVDAILRGAPDPDQDATFEDGYRAQLALDAIVRSVGEKRWVAVQADS